MQSLISARQTGLVTSRIPSQATQSEPSIAHPFMRRPLRQIPIHMISILESFVLEESICLRFDMKAYRK